MKSIEWERFFDESFQMWAVRPKGDRDFNSPRLFHFTLGHEADAFKRLVEKAHISVPAESKAEKIPKIPTTVPKVFNGTYLYETDHFYLWAVPNNYVVPGMYGQGDFVETIEDNLDKKINTSLPLYLIPYDDSTADSVDLCKFLWLLCTRMQVNLFKAKRTNEPFAGYARGLLADEKDYFTQMQKSGVTITRLPPETCDQLYELNINPIRLLHNCNLIVWGNKKLNGDHLYGEYDGIK